MFLTSSSEIDNLQGPDHRNSEGAFLKVGVYISLSICKTHNIMKKATIPRESTYISVVFLKKIIVIAVDLVPLRTALKMVKITKKQPKIDF